MKIILRIYILYSETWVKNNKKRGAGGGRIRKWKIFLGTYPWGQIFISSSEGLRIKSTKVLLKVVVGKGGGSVSIVQNLFLANPCCSREPRLLNCIYRSSIFHWPWTMVANQARKETVEEHTWGKHIGIPPRIAFGGLNTACTRHNIYSFWVIYY